MDNELLVLAAKRGDDEAFYSLILQHKEKMYRIAYTYLRNESDALEAVQETTCRAYMQIRKLKEPSYLGSWLIRILMNYCADEVKRRARRNGGQAIAVRGEPHVASCESASLEKVQLELAVEQLETHYQKVIQLKYYHDLTISEIARTLEKPEGTIKTWLIKLSADYGSGWRRMVNLMDEIRENNEREWPQLEAMKEQIDQLVIPSSIHDAIRNGMRFGRQRRKRRMIRRIAYYNACLLLLVMVASIRFSPAVAAYVSDIPGLRSLVELINYDKGLQFALQNDFIQPVGLSDEHDGIKLTVDGVLADESRVIVFYTLSNMDGRKRVINLQKVKLVDNRDISISHQSTGFNEDWVSKQGTIDFYLHEGAGIPDTLDLEIKVGKDNEIIASDPVWKFVIPVDKVKFEGLKETYDIHQTVTVEDQRITFGTMTVYPTRIGLEVAYDPTNSKKLFYFDDIRIEDAQGEPFGTIMNGITASIMDENRQVLYFQSNFFLKPDRLYLRANRIRAVDKNKLEVQVDLNGKELLSRPDDRLTLHDVGTSMENDGQHVLVFGLKNDEPLDKNHLFNLFDSKYTDASGQTFESNRKGSSFDSFQYYIEETNYLNPLTLTISDYPSRIHGDINIRIK